MIAVQGNGHLPDRVRKLSQDRYSFPTRDAERSHGFMPLLKDALVCEPDDVEQMLKPPACAILCLIACQRSVTIIITSVLVSTLLACTEDTLSVVMPEAFPG